LSKRFSELVRIDRRGRQRNWAELKEAKIKTVFQETEQKVLA